MKRLAVLIIAILFGISYFTASAAEIADDVAKKQLKIVQDIASLLGETAADTLIAINRLKETISDD